MLLYTSISFTFYRVNCIFTAVFLVVVVTLYIHNIQYDKCIKYYVLLEIKASVNQHGSYRLHSWIELFRFNLNKRSTRWGIEQKQDFLLLPLNWIFVHYKIQSTFVESLQNRDEEVHVEKNLSQWRWYDIVLTLCEPTHRELGKLFLHGAGFVLVDKENKLFSVSWKLLSKILYYNIYNIN